MFYGRVVARRLARRQDRIIAISDYTAADIVKFFGLPRERITVVHNGVDHARFHPGSREQARADVAESFGLSHCFFLYVSRLEHPGKNHLGLIGAFEEFKIATHSNWQLVFAGGDWHGAETIHDAIRTSRFAADIRTLGFVSDEQLPDLYRAASAFVYPSLHEGFGMPPIEAMACGCPVISSTRGALGEVIGEAAAIVEPENIESIANQLRLIAGTESVRARMRTLGLEHARKFDWAKSAAETLNVYEGTARS
jgi:glycosyltransferase involved in cell wall biosynthesis